MGAGTVAEIVEKYMTRPIDIDEVDGFYATKGVYEGESIERIEVGKYSEQERKFVPLTKIKLGKKPEYESTDTSYFNVEGFSGAAYEITEQEYETIKKALNS